MRDSGYRLIPIYKRVELVIGDTLVSVEDYEQHKDTRWYVATAGGHAMRTDKVDGRSQTTALHRQIMGLVPGDGLVVDHINGDPLDNRRENLRVCTQAENAQNVKTTGGSSKYRGVCRDQSRKKWLAYCRMPGETGIRNLGRFASEEQAAAVARDFRAKHMPFANEERYG